MFACGGRIDASTSGDPNPGSVGTAPMPTQKPTKSRLPPPDPEPGDDPGVCPLTTVMTEAEMDIAVGSPFKGPPARAAGCSDQDIAELRVNASNEELSSLEDYGTHLTDGCKACMFTRTSDPAWGAIVRELSENGTPVGYGFVNMGACPASATGSMACGKAIVYGEFCVTEACSKCLTYENLNACIAKAKNDICKTAYDAIASSCDATTRAQCGETIVEHVQFLCGLKE